jgi:hypothetical protein
MMVVGCQGEGAPVGSVSTGLVNHAHCPVAVVHETKFQLLSAPANAISEPDVRRDANGIRVVHYS